MFCLPIAKKIHYIALFVYSVNSQTESGPAISTILNLSVMFFLQAQLLDKAAGVHVRFRLGGVSDFKRNQSFPVGISGLL